MKTRTWYAQKLNLETLMAEEKGPMTKESAKGHAEFMESLNEIPISGEEYQECNFSYFERLPKEPVCVDAADLRAAEQLVENVMHGDFETYMPMKDLIQERLTSHDTGVIPPKTALSETRNRLSTSGDPCYVAYTLALKHGSTNEWAEKIIETATCGNTLLSAILMVRDCGSVPGWATRVTIRNLDTDVILNPS